MTTAPQNSVDKSPFMMSSLHSAYKAARTMQESKKQGTPLSACPVCYPIRLPEWPRRRKGDVERLPCQLQDVQPCAVTVDHIDKTPIVDFYIVRHVAVGIGVGVGFRYIERHFDRGLRLADVPNPNAPREKRDRRQLAVQRIIEVLLARVRTEARSTRAVVAPRIFIAFKRIDRHRREHHWALVRIVLHSGTWRRGHGIFDSHIDDETPVRRLVTQIGRRF